MFIRLKGAALRGRESKRALITMLSVPLAVAATSSCVSAGSALPASGQYVAGKGSIAKAGNSGLTIDQSSTIGIINWNSFSIGKKNSVTFDNGNGATLNRVTGANLSMIAGSLHATGSLYLMNTQGVVISGSGRVVTGGNFAASSSSASDTSFDDGDRRLGAAKGRIVNRGAILADGTAELVGTTAQNTGAIKAADVDLRATTGLALAGGTIKASGDAARAGHIIVKSTDGKTAITGTLVARGKNGAGGFIETSGSRVSIAGTVDAGRGGHWQVDPDNLTVTTSAAKTIDTSLDAGTSVKLETTKSATSGPGTVSTGAGDVVIASPLEWTTTAKLTLDAYHSVVFTHAVDATDKGGLSITYANGGNLLFEGGNVEFGSTLSTLAINGHNYTLVSTLAQLGADTLNDNLGYYAISKGIDAKSLGTLGAPPVATSTEFGGVIEGLGNTISYLTIKDNNDEYVGLVGDNATGVVRDIKLADVSITAHSSLSGDDIGGLVGYNGGTVFGSSVSGKISGAASSDTGGLVGINWGKVQESFSTAAVASLGGGAATGGLVGDNEELIASSYATGAVAGGSGDMVGGLVGNNVNQNGIPVSIENSYATGNVSGSNSTIGGLGGLIGLSQGGAIEYAYSTGKVTGTNSYIGGVVGVDDRDGAFKDVFWDTTTSAISASHGAGNLTNDTGIKGEATTTLQGALPAGFSTSVWAKSTSINGGLPYLSALAWSY